MKRFWYVYWHLKLELKKLHKTMYGIQCKKKKNSTCTPGTGAENIVRVCVCAHFTNTDAI